MSLLTLENIVKEYRSKTVLNGASLRVEKGERLALTGSNGSGKTTLIRIAMGLESCDSGNVIVARGTRIGYLSQELSGMDTPAAGTETAVQYDKIIKLERKLREIEKKLEDASGGEAAAGCPRLLEEYARLLERYEGMDGYSIEARIKFILLGLGLKAEALSTPVARLSGGEKMRVAIARLLLEEPDLLILDEPTNHMDIQAAEWLEGYLKRFDGGVLFVSHDRYFLDQVATRIAELENGGIIERSGSYSTFIEQRERMRQFALKEQNRLEREIVAEEKKARSLKGESSHRTRNISAWKSREKMVGRLREKLRENREGAIPGQHLHGIRAPRVAFKDVRHVSAEIAKAEGLKKVFGSSTLFKELDFMIRGGEKVGIIGPNGCGKTTLLNILLGRDGDFEGFARLGHWVRYAYLGQEVYFEDEGRSILEEVLTVKEMSDREARNYLAGFQFFGDDLNKRIEVLSGGERVRLYLSCIMLTEPDCLIMDEPTNHLDIAARNAVEAALTDFKGTLIAVSHDRFFLTRCVNRILELDGGRLKNYQGNYEFYRQARDGLKIESAAASGGNRPKKNKRKFVLHTPARIPAVEKPDRVRVESDIFKLEGRLGELEASFGEGAPLEVYTEYESVTEELQKLYELWEQSEDD